MKLFNENQMVLVRVIIAALFGILVGGGTMRYATPSNNNKALLTEIKNDVKMIKNDIGRIQYKMLRTDVRIEILENKLSHRE